MLNWFVVSIVNTEIPFSNYKFKPMLLYFQSLLRRFIKPDVLDVSPVKLVKLDVTDQKLWDIDAAKSTYVCLKKKGPRHSG